MKIAKTHLRLIVAAVFLSIFSFTFFTMTPNTQAISTDSFNPNRIIDDSIFFNGNRMSAQDVQAFLVAKVPSCDTNGTKPYGDTTRAEYGTSQGYPPPYICLRDYSVTYNSIAADSYCGGIPGGTKSAAELIVIVGQACGINPQVMLITLQKEQSLITDDWPWPIQYTKATGYGCPDTALSTDVDSNQNGCYDEFEGFFKQIYYGARQFKRYIMQPDVFNYAVGRTSYVAYNPNASCGGTNLTPNTQATAALYNYTPYQPNDATLDAPEGTVVDCGAYGNLNFWRKFNDWFGPTLTDEFAVIMADNGDTTQWVLENGKRYVIPDTATKVAWGLSPKWDQPFVFNGSYISTLPSGNTLGRVARPAGGLAVYFVDSGRKYKFTSVEALATWGYGTGSIIDTPPGLSNNASTQGNITYTISLTGDSRIFLMDGGTLRHITDPNALAAWAGDSFNNIPVSDDYFLSRPEGSSIASNKISDGTNIYFVDRSRKLSADSKVLQLFPDWQANSVSSATLNRLALGPSLTYLIKANGATAVHLIDNKMKHHVTDPYILKAWQSKANPSTVTEVTTGFTNLVPTGVQISDYLMSDGSATYVMQEGLRTVPTSLTTAYTTGRTVYAGSSQLKSLYSSLAGVTGLVKAIGQPEAYIITDTGQLRHLTSTDLFWLWGKNQILTELVPQNLNRYVKGGGISAFVTDGTTNYLIESAQKHPITDSIKVAWGLGEPNLLDAGTLGRITSGTPAGTKLQGEGRYIIVSEGRAYTTVDTNIANLWGATNAPVMDLAIVRQYLTNQMLTRVVKSSISGDTRLFIVDRGVLYHLSPQHAANLAISEPYAPVNPNLFTVSTWAHAVVADEGGVVYGLDGGVKRLIPAGVIRDQWTSGNYESIPVMTNGFLNMLPNGIQIERAIKGSGPNVYAAQNFTKRWIKNPDTYSSSYAPFTLVSDSLLSVLPNGADIN